MTKKTSGRERENPLRAIGDITELKRAEQALRDSEEQWRSLVENIPDIVMTLDCDGTILFINRTPPGFTVEATIGAIVYDCVPPEYHDTLRRSLEGVFETRDGYDYEVAAPGPFGLTSWYFNRIGPIVRDGRVVAAAVIATDITERKRAEEALRESEERYRDLVEDINDIIFAVDADGRIIYISPVVTEVGGYSLSEMAGRSFTDFIHPDDVPSAVEGFQRSISGDHEPVELRFLSKSGELRWLRSFGRPVLEGDRVVGLRGVLTDFTERKLAEEELRESEEKYRRLAQDSIDGIVIAEGPEMTFVNRALLKMFGCQSEEEMVGRPFTDFVSPEYREPLLERNRAREQGQSVPTHYEFKALRRDGSTFDAEVSIGRISYQGRAATQAVVRDITERKRAEQAVSREVELNSSIAEVSRVLIESRPIDDISDVVLECAKRLTSSAFGFVGYIDPQTGYLVSPTLTKDIWDACQVPDKDIIFKEFSGLWGWVLDNRKPLLTNAPADDPRSSGTPPGHVPVHRFLSVPALIGGTLVGQVAVANSDRDYTERDLLPLERLAVLYALAVERKRAEEALRQSENRYRTLVEAAPDVIYALSMDGSITSLNSAFESISGWSRAEWLGKHFTPIIHPDDLPAVMEDFRLVLRGEVPPVDEYRMLTECGQYVTVETVPRPLIVNGKVVGTFGIARDITERKRMEEALQSAREELESKVERQMQRGGAYGLTFRELTVLHLVADGRADRDIGGVLGISTLTVQKHVEKIRHKMKVSSRTEASVRAVREGLLE